MGKHEHQDHSNPMGHIQLKRAEDNTLWVLPTPHAGQPDLAPFPLPPMALSNTIWLSSLSESMWQRWGRCMALWLVLDCRKHRWLPPTIPHQRCSREGAAWRMDPRDLADIPNFCRVGGSFQTRVADGPTDAESSVPPLDGLHLVQGIGPKSRVLYAFVRAEGVIQCVEPGGVINDDWHAALDTHRDRLQLI